MLGAKDWPPDVVLDTPIPLLEIALKGTSAFIIATSPFGKPAEDDEDDEPADPTEAAEDFVSFLSQRSKGRPPP